MSYWQAGLPDAAVAQPVTVVTAGAVHSSCRRCRTGSRASWSEAPPRSSWYVLALDGLRVRIEHLVVGVVGVVEERGRAEARLRVDVGVVPGDAGPAGDGQQDGAGFVAGLAEQVRGVRHVVERLGRIGPARSQVEDWPAPQ